MDPNEYVSTLLTIGDGIYVGVLNVCTAFGITYSNSVPTVDQPTVTSRRRCNAHAFRRTMSDWTIAVCLRPCKMYTMGTFM